MIIEGKSGIFAKSELASKSLKIVLAASLISVTRQCGLIFTIEKPPLLRRVKTAVNDLACFLPCQNFHGITSDDFLKNQF